MARRELESLWGLMLRTWCVVVRKYRRRRWWRELKGGSVEVDSVSRSCFEYERVEDSTSRARVI